MQRPQTATQITQGSFGSASKLKRPSASPDKKVARAAAAAKGGPEPVKSYDVFLLEDRAQTESQLERKYGSNVDDLCTDHEQLIE